MIDLRAGQVFACGPSVTTVLPSLDFETYSEAGYVWDGDAAKWRSLPGLSAQNRGLGAVGARNYIEHPTFEILSLAYDLLDGKGLRHYTPPFGMNRASGQRPPSDTLPWDLFIHVMEGGLLAAWNSGFEWQVWEFFATPCWGWPALKLSQMRCDMAKSRAYAFPGALEDAASMLKTQPKDKRGKELIQKLTVPRNPTKKNPALRATPFTHSQEFQEFYAYNDTDVVAEIDAGLRLPDLTPRELRVWMLDQVINMRGMGVDMAAVENCIAVVEQAYQRYNAELSTITGGAAQESTEVQAMVRWMQHAHGVYFNGLDEEVVADALKRKNADGSPYYPPAVMRVLRIRQLLAFGSVKKLYAFRAQTTSAGRLHDQYVYYGAHTSLWNGRGVQPANLYKGIFSKPAQVEYALKIIAARNLDLLAFEYGPHGSWVQEGSEARGGAPGAGSPVDELEVVASLLRSMIRAKPGHRFISADFTAIQAVATSALAGEEWRLEVFRTHGKIYEAMASKLTNTPLQFYLDYKKQHGKHHDHRQNPGKLAVLSGDFGAWIDGWKRFGADKLLGADENIKAAILKTRAAQPMIVELWGGQTRNKFGRDANGQRATERAHLYGLEGAAISAVLYPGQAFGYRGVVYQQFEDTLYCCPPSGGFIRYHAPRLEKSHKDYAAPWDLDLTYSGWNSNAMKGPPGLLRMSLYGGVLTQNVVSHVCREIQADALLALEAAGYLIVMHTHDEQVAEVPDGFGSAQGYIEVARASLPAWAVTPDGKPWPIKIPDAWEAQSYGKWED